MYHYSGNNNYVCSQIGLREAARLLGGEVWGTQILAPGPGHSKKDRSLSVKIDPAAPNGMRICSFARDPFITCRDHVASKLGLPLGATRSAIHSRGARR